MRILFSLFSILYIASIFILAGSPIVERLSGFNPYSLLHIPLYGILTFLLIFSIVPTTRRSKDSSIQPHSHSSRLRSKDTIDLRRRLFIAGLFALAVGILDEAHQLYVPGRDASVSDAVLDMIGITLALFLFFQLFKAGVVNLKQ
jgi:VanZ family protein